MEKWFASVTSTARPPSAEGTLLWTMTNMRLARRDTDLHEPLERRGFMVYGSRRIDLQQTARDRSLQYAAWWISDL